MITDATLAPVYATFLHDQKCLSVRHGGRDLRPVSDDPWIGRQFVDSRLGASHYPLRIELAKCAAVALGY